MKRRMKDTENEEGDERAGEFGQETERESP